MTPQFHTLSISDVARETSDAVSIAFAVPDTLRTAYAFLPGQYLTLRSRVDGADIRRSYSICAGLDDSELRVAIKRVEGGIFSSFANSQLRTGDKLEVMTPMGRFTASPEPAHSATYLGIACGSGITPILSILKSVLSREPDSRFVLLYGNRNSQSILFRDALDDLKDRYLGRLTVHHVLSREAQDIPLLHGRLDGERIKRLMQTMLPAASIDNAYLCGPQEMTIEARAALQALGVEPDHIHVELFTPAEGLIRKPLTAPKERVLDTHAQITITFDGATQTIPGMKGESIIEAATRAGLDLPYSCRGGMCCTCRARITEGSVEMTQNFSLEPWEIAAGFTLTCQAHAMTDRVAVDFDAA